MLQGTMGLRKNQTDAKLICQRNALNGRLEHVKNRLSLLCFFLFWVTSLPTLGQNNQWIRTIEEQAVLMVPGQHGTLYSLSWQTNCPDDYIVVRFYKPDGTVQHAYKSFVYLGLITTYKAFTNSSNHLVLYLRDNGTNHMLYEFDSSGVMIWNNNIQFTTPKIKYDEFIPGKDCFYLAGSDDVFSSVDTCYAYLTKLSLTGQHKWTKKYKLSGNVGSNIRFHDVFMKGDTLLAVGHFYKLPFTGWQPYRPLITKLDTAGTVYSSSYYMVDSGFVGFDDYSFQQIVPSTNGSFYLSGWNSGNEHAIFRLDAGLNVEWIQYWSSGRVKQLTAGYNDDVWMVQDYGYANYIFHLGSNGAVLPGHGTRNPVGGPNLAYGKAFSLQRHDCGFILSNDENLIWRTDTSMKSCLDSNYTDFELYSAETDYDRRSVSLQAQSISPLGQYFTTATYNSITSTSTAWCAAPLTTCSGNSGPSGLTSIHEELMQVFPNPASAYLQVHLPEEITESGQLNLFDFHGRVVQTWYPASGGYYQLQLESMPMGMYLLVYQSEKHFAQRTVQIVR